MYYNSDNKLPHVDLLKVSNMYLFFFWDSHCPVAFNCPVLLRTLKLPGGKHVFQLGFCCNSLRLIKLFSKISKIEEKIINPQMVTHLSTVKSNGCLALLILPFTLTA